MTQHENLRTRRDRAEEPGPRGWAARMRGLPVLAAAVAVLTACGTPAGSAADSPPPAAQDTTTISGLAEWQQAEDAAVSFHTGEPVALSTTGNPNCPTGDLEGVFLSSAEMALFLECVIPNVEEWIDATYANMSSPTGYYFIPAGVSGAESAAAGSCDFDEFSLSYCRLSGNVYLGEAAVWLLYLEFGDAAPALVLAHEVTHHFQNVVGIPPAQTANEQIPYENQADCGGGAFMAYAESQGWLNVHDDLVDVAGALRAAGERKGADRSHGTPQQRLRAFDLGYLSGKGLWACVRFVPGFPIIT
jgi:hypothetical protein